MRPHGPWGPRCPARCPGLMVSWRRSSPSGPVLITTLLEHLRTAGDRRAELAVLPPMPGSSSLWLHYRMPLVVKGQGWDWGGSELKVKDLRATHPGASSPGMLTSVDGLSVAPFTWGSTAQ